MAANPALARSRIEGALASVGVQVCFGLFPLFLHWAADPREGFAPRALVVWRICFGALVLVPVAFLRHRGRFRVARADLPRLFVAGVLGVSANMALAGEGMSRTSVLSAGLLVTQIPVFTYAVAVLCAQERVQARRALGIAVALSGAALLVVARGSGSSPLGISRLGPLLMVANCIAYAIYLVLARELLARIPLLVVIAWVFLLSLPTLPFVAIGVDLVPERVGPRAALGFAYTLLFPTVLAYLLNAYALARVLASTAAVFIYLQPLVAGAAAALVLGEAPTPVAWVAGALSFAGIWLVAGGPAGGEPARGGASGSIQRFAGRVFQSRRQARCTSSSGKDSSGPPSSPYG